MKLQDIYKNGQPVPIVAVIGDRELTLQVQDRLRDLGLYLGQPDGVYGRITADALSKFATAYNQPDTGISATLAKKLIEAKSVPGFDPTQDYYNPTRIAAATGCSLDSVTEYLPNILDALKTQNILDKPTAIAAFATIAIETAYQFAPISEYGGNQYFTQMYEGREDLGNTEPGDGARYHGRGFIQITGRANYRHYGEVLGCDLEGNPNLALDGAIAASILALYFKENGVPYAAQVGHWETVRRIVNGGLNGWDEFARCVDNLLARL